jgi:hypothetical protein
MEPAKPEEKKAAPESASELAKSLHAPDLAKIDGMVTQVWEDGEITTQKAGRLLWKRELHQQYPPLPGAKFQMPVALGAGEHSYAFVTHQDALRVRARMCRDGGIEDPSGAQSELAAYESARQEGKDGDPETVTKIIAQAVARAGVPPLNLPANPESGSAP